MPAAKSVVDEFMAEKPPHNPESCTLYTYPAIRAFAQAAEKAKSVELDDLSDGRDGDYSAPPGDSEPNAEQRGGRRRGYWVCTAGGLGQRTGQ